PSGAVSVACGAEQAFAIAADDCYAIADVTVDGVSQGPVSGYTFSNVQADHTIDASFVTAAGYTIVASAGPGGQIVPSGPTPVPCGGDQLFKVNPDDCFVIADVTVDGASQGQISSYQFTNVHADHTIEATFATAAPYTISSSAGPGGSISPDGSTSVACG